MFTRVDMDEDGMSAGANMSVGADMDGMSAGTDVDHMSAGEDGARMGANSTNMCAAVSVG